MWRCRTIVLLIALIGVPAPQGVLAQGIIYGTVTAPGGASPPEGALFWMGFLHGTDEEVRIETNVGSGYDGTFWFDDFQNYTTEAAGVRFDYLFHHPDGGAFAHVIGVVPDNSFENLDVVLADGPPLPRPQIISATFDAESHVRLTWHSQPGVTHRVYRRETINNGVFHRMDDPAGVSVNGVADTVFIDSATSPGGDYTYIIAGVDASGVIGPHSPEVTAQASTGCECPHPADIDESGSLDVVDLQLMIAVVFFTAAEVRDPGCLSSRPDFDCSGTVNIVDIQLIINHLFFQGQPPCNPCD